MGKDIFISYRRKSSMTEAALLYEKLTNAGYGVFLDYMSMHSGKFTKELESTISNCTDFILLLPPAALNRCRNPDDCFRMEIECALRENKNIIIILINQDDLPKNLPESLQKLSEYHYVQSVPLEYMEELSVRLQTQHLHSKPKDPTRIMQQASDELDWEKVSAPKWTVCPVCGSREITIDDAKEAYLQELKTAAMQFHWFGFFVSPLLVFAAIFLYGIPALNQWLLGLLQSYDPELYVVWTGQDMTHILPKALSIFSVFGIPFCAVLARNILRKYSDLLTYAEEEAGTRESLCTCDNCAATYYAEVPLTELSEQQEVDKLECGLNLLVTLAMFAVFCWAAGQILTPPYKGLAPILSVLVFCAVYTFLLLYNFPKYMQAKI